MSFSNLTTNVWDRRTRKMLDDMIDAKLRRVWFENYESNKPLILKHGSYDQAPDLPKTEVIVVGAGWSLSKNIKQLAGEDVPVFACDKTAHMVCRYVKPYAVSAVNTEKTQIGEWLKKFNDEMAVHDYDPDDVTLFVPITINPEIFDVWRGNRVCFMNADNTVPELQVLAYKETGIPPSLRGSNVGMFSVINATTMGAKKIVLMGMTYCYKTMEEALKATRGEGFVAMKDITKSNPDDVLKMGFVYGTLEWVESKNEIVEYAYAMVEHVRILNCSHGGILYERGLIEPCDFGAWKTFLGDKCEMKK